MRRYREVLGLPGVRTLIALMFFARIPLLSKGIILTLHVAIGLRLGYGAAGVLVAASTTGIALGAPVLGRMIDRHGLRPVVALTTIVEVAFWLAARWLPYPVLLPTALVVGLFKLQATSVGRQAIAALVPPELRRTAYSLDSIEAELSAMVGPLAAVLVATRLSTGTALLAVAVAQAVIGLALYVVNPPTRGQQVDAESPARGTWLTRRLTGVLITGVGALFVLVGTELAIVAQLRERSQAGWIGVVLVIWAGASLIGGLTYGALHRSANVIMLMALMSVLTVPVGLAGAPWWLLALALIPAGAVCAPTIAATGDEVSRAVPERSRGVATGLQASSFTVGSAAGAPVVGFVIDQSSAAWGFAAAGIGGILIATVAATVSGGLTTHRRVSG